jgi:ATP-dependent helicase/nuclease subunit A
VQEGLEQAGAVPCEMPTGPGLRLQHGEWGGATAPTATAIPVGTVPQADYPAVLPHDPTQGQMRTPSDLGGSKVLAGETDGELLDTALARGRFVHLLLEHLPGLDQAAQRDWAKAVLANSPDAPLLPDSAVLTDQVIGMLADPALARLFRDGLPEVALTAALPDLDGERLTGQIDRLIITDALIRVIDFKTNRLVPATPDQVPDGVLRQMGAYLAMVTAIWPERAVQAEILWTATGHLMPLPSALCMAALRRAAIP